MSTLSKLYAGSGQAFEVASEKLAKLEIDVDPKKAAYLYSRLERMSTYADTSETPPGVKGFDMALSTCLILVGEETPQTIPEFLIDDEGSQYINHIARPFNIIVNRKSNEKNRQLERAVERGYRLGLYVIGNLSPKIEYLDSHVPIEGHKILANHTNSNRSIVGRHITQNSIGVLNIGYSPGIFPSNAERIYSYSVEPLTSF